MGLLITVGGSHVALGREAADHGFLTLGPLHLHVSSTALMLEWRGCFLLQAMPSTYRPSNGARWEHERTSSERVGGYFFGWTWDFFRRGRHVAAA